MLDRYHDNIWYTRSDVDWAYIKINRTGSTWLENYLVDNGFKREEPKKLKNHHKLVILRHPIDRFLSGVSFFDEFYDKLIANPSMTFPQYITDPHFKPQTLFLREVDLNNCTFVQYNKNLPKNIESFLKEHNVTMKNPPAAWTGKVTPFTQNLKDKTIMSPDKNTQVRFDVMNRMDNDVKFESKIKSYFVDDFKLYDTVKWYGKN